MTTAAAPAALNLPRYSAAGERTGEMPAPAAFNDRPRDHVVYLAVLRQLANARTGTHSTLTKGEVSGGGKKPWKQKHTGRARQGSTRNPHWPGGGVSFGPKPHLYKKDMPAAARRQALRSVFAAKARAGAVAVLESLALPGAKTREAAALLKKMGLGGPVLVVIGAANADSRRAFRNLPDARLEPAHAVSVFDVLNARSVVLLADALPPLAKRCGAEAA